MGHLCMGTGSVRDACAEAAAGEEGPRKCFVVSHALNGGFRQLGGNKRGKVAGESKRHPVHYRITEDACNSLSATRGGQRALPFWALLRTQHSSRVQCLRRKKGPLPVSGLSVFPSTQGSLEEVRNIIDP